MRSVLEGSIRRAGNRVRITAQLIDATNGAHLWADRYDRDLTDIFEVQDDVTRRIVEALKVTLSPAEKARLTDTETPNIDAYDCVLRGREFMLGNDQNRETFEQASKLLPQGARTRSQLFASAYAGLSFAYIFDYQNRWSDDPDSLAAACQGIRANRRSRRTRTNRWRTVSPRCARSFGKDLDQAKSEIDIALSLNPEFSPGA